MLKLVLSFVSTPVLALPPAICLEGEISSSRDPVTKVFLDVSPLPYSSLAALRSVFTWTGDALHKLLSPSIFFVPHL